MDQYCQHCFKSGVYVKYWVDNIQSVKGAYYLDFKYTFLSCSLTWRTVMHGNKNFAGNEPRLRTTSATSSTLTPIVGSTVITAINASWPHQSHSPAIGPQGKYI